VPALPGGQNLDQLHCIGGYVVAVAELDQRRLERAPQQVFVDQASALTGNIVGGDHETQSVERCPGDGGSPARRIVCQRCANALRLLIIGANQEIDHRFQAMNHIGDDTVGIDRAPGEGGKFGEEGSQELLEAFDSSSFSLFRCGWNRSRWRNRTFGG